MSTKMGSIRAMHAHFHLAPVGVASPGRRSMLDTAFPTGRRGSAVTVQVPLLHKPTDQEAQDRT